MTRAALTTIAVLLLATTAQASPGDVQKADTLFRKGRAAMKAGDLGKACPALEESYGLDPAPGTAVNLGDCFEKQGKVASALLAYQAARKLLRPGDPRIGPVEKQIAALEKRAPKLTITLAPDAPEGTKVTRDGKSVDFSELGSPLVVNPGEVTLVIGAPGRARRTYVVPLGERESRVVVVDAGVAEVGLPGSPTSASSHPQVSSVPDGENETSNGSAQQTIGYVVGTVGVGFLIFGTANAAIWNSKNRALDDAATNRDVAKYDDVEPQRNGARERTLWGFGLGAAALTTSAVLVLTSPSAERTAARVQVMPGLFARGVGGQVGGTW